MAEEYKYENTIAFLFIKDFYNSLNVIYIDLLFIVLYITKFGSLQPLKIPRIIISQIIYHKNMILRLCVSIRTNLCGDICHFY